MPTEFSGTEGFDTADVERRRFIVCGDNPLALRLVDELASRYGGDVTAVVRSVHAGYGLRMMSVSRFLCDPQR